VSAALPSPSPPAPVPGGADASRALVQRLLRASQACALLAIAVGAFGLIGTFAGIGVLTSVHPNLGPIPPASALAATLAGTALLLLHPRYHDSAWERLARLLPWPLLALSVLTLAEYLLRARFHERFFLDSTHAVHGAYPGHMSMVAALGFTLLGAALLLVWRGTRSAHRAAKLLALATAVMLLVGLLGLLYGQASLYAMPVFDRVSVHAIAALLLVAAGILGVQPARGFPSLLASPDAGGRLARRLLPFAFATPLLLGWLRLLGERAGLFRPDEGVDLMVVTLVVLFVALIWWNARRLDRAARKARQDQAALQAYAEEVRDLYERAPCGYHSLDGDGVIVRINDTELAWLGYARDEVVGKLRFQDLLTPHSQQLFRERFPKYLAQGEHYDVEYEMRRKDGSVLPVSLSATTVLDAEGRYVMSRSTVFDITERRRVEQALRESEAAVRALALTDPLTGMANRRRLDQTLHGEIARVQRYGGRLSVVLTDLDHFKRINDEHGHAIGDQVLHAFARIIRDHVRETDLVARYGGEEFVIVMPEASAHDAQACAERIRAALAAQILPPLARPITATFGVAEFAPDDSDRSLLHRADQALYRGKASGRNCVRLAEAGPPPRS
jgi:diguanylate cyclase (GGDEF)-like protein/PAS domain S-box-containing protein